MKILFTGLGPKDTVIHDNNLYRNGSYVELPVDIANAYIRAKLAVVAGSEKEVEAFQNLEIKNDDARSAAESVAAK